MARQNTSHGRGVEGEDGTLVHLADAEEVALLMI